MPAGSALQKVCVVCGKDLAGKERLKDAQGRYLCPGRCQAQLADRARSKPTVAAPAMASKAPAAAVAPVDDLMAKLVADLPVTQPCPTCGIPMRPEAVMCTRCGHNRATGRQTKTRVVKVREKTQAEKAIDTSAEFFLSPLVSALLVIAVMGAIGVVGALVQSFATIALGIIAASYLIALVWAIIDAFGSQETRMGYYMTAHVVGVFLPGVLRISGLIGFFIAIYYVCTQTGQRYLTALYCGTGLALVGFVGTLYYTGKLPF